MSTAHTKMEAAHGPSSSIDPSAFIHPLAYMTVGVKIGARSRVWQFASVVRGAVLGNDCSVASGVTIDGAWFGERCVISQGVTTAPGLVCLNDVFLGPNVSICNDRWPRADRNGFEIDKFQDGAIAVLIKNSASVGARSVVLPGVTIGERAMVAAGSVVDRDVTADHLWKRDGTMVPIKPRMTSRMRFVG